MNNPTQSVFLFMDRQHLQVSQSTHSNATDFLLTLTRDSVLTFDCNCSLSTSSRLLKPRPQCSSCAASAYTCLRTSWPAGVWETSRITSARTCLIKASCIKQPHRKKPFPSFLPKPSEANWCTHLHSFPVKRFELVLGSLPFLLPTHYLPSLTEADSVPIPVFFFPPHAPNVLFSFCFFWIGSPLFFFYSLSTPAYSLIHFCSFEPARTLILSGWLFSWSCTINSTGHWRNSLCCIKTGTNNTQVFTVVLRWTCLITLWS